HLANDMSWDDLANKRIEHLNGTSEIWFSPQELSAGAEIAQLAVARSEEKANAKKKESRVAPRDRSPSSEP
ncbi:MAG TPA: hypothetical protein VGJ16_11780, partial [Pirellulales bacterium]